ncbi:MAG: HEAT repeat domain-containing protein [Acidobacteriota bacterium]
MRSTIALALALGAAACASAPPAPRTPPAPVPAAIPRQTFEEKMTWILRLEDQRMLRDPAAPTPSPDPGRAGSDLAAARTADLVPLLSDEEPRVRRRAALAVGRVKLPEGVDPLLPLLRDSDPEVRQMAAFALGLLGDRRARDPLVLALNDMSPLVQASAAEGLGLLGDPAAAAPLSVLLSRMIQSGAVVERPGEDEDTRRDTPASAFRLALFALVRLKAYDQLAAAVLDGSGQPRIRWWPVAFALQRLEDKRAATALMALAREPHPYTRAFAVKGLGALGDRTAVPLLIPIASGGDRAAIEAVRALGRLGDPAGAAPLLKTIRDRTASPVMRFEAIAAVGGINAPGVSDLLLDVLSDPSPEIRAAALRANASSDPETFVTALSGLDPDPNWTVRAALATVLGSLDPAIGLPRLMTMLSDSDQRVIPSVLAGLVKLKAPNLATILLDHLKADDPPVRAAAAVALGELKPAAGAQALATAYQRGQRDTMYAARAAALAALRQYGSEAAEPVLTTALSDADWAVRLRAAALLKELKPSADADHQIRPAPTRIPADAYRTPRLITPRVSPQVYVEMDRGTIQIELAVLDAPITAENFVQLARSGFFNGLSAHRVVANFVVQTGDPRGDSEGGPGYTVRDELNQLPYLRGSVGMALDWADTGGSQFFITLSPQPHLDAKYTVFGQVVGGMDVVDAIQPGDIIRRVRVWDGETLSQ